MGFGLGRPGQGFRTNGQAIKRARLIKFNRRLAGRTTSPFSSRLLLHGGEGLGFRGPDGSSVRPSSVGVRLVELWAFEMRVRVGKRCQGLPRTGSGSLTTV